MNKTFLSLIVIGTLATTIARAALPADIKSVISGEIDESGDVSASLQISQEYGNAWIETVISEESPGAESPPMVTTYRNRIKGLTFDKITGVLSLVRDGKTVVCGHATGRGDKLKLSGCKMQAGIKQQKVNDGFRGHVANILTVKIITN